VRILAPTVRPYTAHLLGTALTLGLDAWLTALRPWPLKVVIDRVISEGSCRVPLFGQWINNPDRDRITILAAACAVTLIIAIGTGICTYIYTMLLGTVSQGLLFLLRSRLFSHLQQLSLRFHDRIRLGDIMVRLTSDISSIQMLIARGLMQFLSNALLVFFMLAMMLWLNWKFALIACSVTPLLFWSVWWHTRQIKAESRSARESDGMLAAVAHESLSMIRLVKGLGHEDLQQSTFDEQGRQSLQHYTARLRHQSRMAPIVDIFAAAGLVLIMWFGAREVIQGRLTTGDIIVFFSYVTNFYSPIRAMSRQASVFTKATVGAERIAEVLANEPEVRDRPTARHASTLKGAVLFESVNFSYTEGQPVLREFTLKISPGERIAIIGPTGVGKSTIIALLLKLYEPHAGRILLDGTDIREFTATSVRRQIGLVMEDSMLFRASIRENVLYGLSEGSGQDVAKACRIAQAEEFIRRLPDGFDTIVAESGKSLSGGQRQRLAIARAIVRQAPILLLDEPTSNLDIDSESAVIQSLSGATAGRTTILITHRPETLKLVDRVIVLEAGRIIDDCSPEEVRLRYANRLLDRPGNPQSFFAEGENEKKS